jgi:hypothetical protein
MTYYLHKQYIFHVKIQLFWRKSAASIRIRMGLASWIRIRAEVKCWIRIRIDTTADTQHCYVEN